MKAIHGKTDSTSRPEAEKAFLAGLLELLTDNPRRCREAVALVEPSALTIEAGPTLLQAIAEAAGLEAPSLADVMRIARDRCGDDASGELALVADLSAASVGNSGGYAPGVKRHAREIVKAATRRKTIEAAAIALVVAKDETATEGEIAAAAAAVPAASVTIADESEAWVPFPVELLPEPLAEYVRQSWVTLGKSADPVCIALPLLAAAAATIGPVRRFQVWPTYVVPPVLWGLVVGESGSKKSPSFDAGTFFLRNRHAESCEQWQREMDEWRALEAQHKAAGRSKNRDQLEPLPEPPMLTQYLADDVTIESLVPLFKARQSVLLADDELSGWVGSFDRYSSKEGADEARYLKLYDGKPWTKNRVSGFSYVSAALLSIAGAIQPRVLAKSFGGHVYNGLLPRFMLVEPPEGRAERPNAGVDFATMTKTRDLFDVLLAIPTEDGRPKVVELNSAAAGIFNTFWVSANREREATKGPFKAMLAKGEAWAIRLAGVIHTCRQAAESTLPHDIDAESIERGIGLARWFMNEWKRVYRKFERGGVDNETGAGMDGRLREWIAARGGVASVREVRRGLRRYQNPAQAEEGLRRLVASGAAEWAADSTGGRPADAVRLK